MGRALFVMFILSDEELPMCYNNVAIVVLLPS